jgi:hypothetical protein
MTGKAHREKLPPRKVSGFWLREALAETGPFAPMCKEREAPGLKRQGFHGANEAPGLQPILFPPVFAPLL